MQSIKKSPFEVQKKCNRNFKVTNTNDECILNRCVFVNSSIDIGFR